MTEDLLNLETVNKKLFFTYQDLSENHNLEVNRILEDVKIYKNSFETLQNVVNNEHDFISKSLYELAYLFINLKGRISEDDR